MSAILKFDFQKRKKITFFWNKLSKLHKKYPIFPQNRRKQEQTMQGLSLRRVKTYFDRKAVKTRLKLVKTGLNRSKHGQNLKLRNTCQGLWKNPIRWMYVYPSVYGLCIWNAKNWI